MKKTLALLLAALILALCSCSMINDIKANVEKNANREILDTPEADAVPALFKSALETSFTDALKVEESSSISIGNTLANGYPEHWIRALGKRVKKVHFKDYRVAAGGLHGFVDLLAGDVNYPAVTDALAEIGYDGWVTAEMIPAYTHYPDALIYNTSNAMDWILGRK